MTAYTTTVASSGLGAGRIAGVKDRVCWTDSTSLKTYTKSAGVWSLVNTLALPSSGFGDLAMTADGQYLLVGRYLDDVAGSNAGTIISYQWTGSAWSELTRIYPTGIKNTAGVTITGLANAFFGIAFGMNADGSKIVVQMGSGAGINSSTTTGLTIMTGSPSGGYTQTGVLAHITNPISTQVSSLALDGSHVYWGQQTAGGDGNGRVCRVPYDTSNTWVADTNVLTVPVGPSTAAAFGRSLALASNGTLLVGGDGADYGGYSNLGVVAVYDNWALRETATVHLPTNSKGFGYNVAVDGDKPDTFYVGSTVSTLLYEYSLDYVPPFEITDTSSLVVYTLTPPTSGASKVYAHTVEPSDNISQAVVVADLIPGSTIAGAGVAVLDNNTAAILTYDVNGAKVHLIDSGGTVFNSVVVAPYGVAVAGVSRAPHGFVVIAYQSPLIKAFDFDGNRLDAGLDVSQVESGIAPAVSRNGVIITSAGFNSDGVRGVVWDVERQKYIDFQLVLTGSSAGTALGIDDELNLHAVAGGTLTEFDMNGLEVTTNGVYAVTSPRTVVGPGVLQLTGGGYTILSDGELTAVNTPNGLKTQAATAWGPEGPRMLGLSGYTLSIYYGGSEDVLTTLDSGYSFSQPVLAVKQAAPIVLYPAFTAGFWTGFVSTHEIP